jgi:hypothetical protein
VGIGLGWEIRTKKKFKNPTRKFDVWGTPWIMGVYEVEYLALVNVGDETEFTNPTFPPAAAGSNMGHPPPVLRGFERGQKT